MKRIFVLISLFFIQLNTFSQPQNLNNGEIFLGLQRLAVVGNVMYIAAHPDDENTLLITWLSKEKKVRTAYFAMTRGDGGQNLIGTEQGEYAGLLRTHELLEARKVDGGEQYFSRALDFGFSKTTEETLRFWDKDKVLGDLVYRIRKFKPDVIINRFPPDSRAGHGHHSASAVLSIEAFDLAGDPSAYPEQLTEVTVWQPKKLLWNTFGGGFTNTTPQEENYLKVSLGDYNPVLGESYTETAARARSKHRSQGFGSAPSRGERYDYFVYVKGELSQNDIFDGIDLTWNRLAGGKPIAKAIEEVLKKFDFQNPEKSVKDLLNIYKLIEALPDSTYKIDKLEECRSLIFSCLGLYFEVNSDVDNASPGQSVKLQIRSVNRTNTPIFLKNLKITGVAQADTLLDASLKNNLPYSSTLNLKIPANAEITQPYWLKEPSKIGSYIISDEKYRNLPMAPDPVWANLSLLVDGVQMTFNQPVKYKYVNPARGEIYKYFEIRPEVTLNFDQNVYVKKDEFVKIGVVVKNNIPQNRVNVKLDVPTGWRYTPVSVDLNFSGKNEQVVYFEVSPAVGAEKAEIKAVATNNRGIFDKSHKHVFYEHIPELNTYPLAVAKVISPELKIVGRNIGYIMGAGDEVPASLAQIGYNVKTIDETSIKGNLSTYDAIIVGVRAYNTEDWLVDNQNNLLDYVKNGGNLIVQYQTQSYIGTVKTSKMGPYPFSIGRGRVTEEDAKVNFINPDDPVLNYPNKITPKDFEGWIQERGLYFADKWSDEYIPVISMNDTGEQPDKGSLLYAKYGDGYFVFTGLSFFRELPAGVPGAYRLMVNLISLGKE